MNTHPVPGLDPTPLPGPAWLFHGLLVFTFFLHALFMNLALGGTLLATVVRAGRASPARQMLARRLVGVNGYGISFAITTGIAPLLFVQLLFQQYFYTATILIGNAWLLVVALLLVGYYALHLHKSKKNAAATQQRDGGWAWLAVAGTCFLAIAAVHVAVHLIHVQPAKWSAIAAAPWSVIADRTYVPRLLHFLAAGLGFSALLMTWWAVRQARAGREVELNTQVAGYAWKWVLWTTAVQVVDGLALVGLLPNEVLLGLMRGGATTLVPLSASLLLGLGLLMMLARVSDPTHKPGLVTGTLGTMLLTIAVMVIVRHQVRGLYLQSFTSQTVVHSAAQWGNFLLFVLLLLAGLATVAYMIRHVMAHTAEGDQAA